MRLISRTVATALVAVLAATAANIEPSAAAPAKQAKVINSQAQAGTVDATDLSARKRHRRYRGGSAIGFRMFSATLGTIAALVAANRARDYYYAPAYPYGYVPAYGYPPPYTYQPYVYQPYVYQQPVYQTYSAPYYSAPRLHIRAFRGFGGHHHHHHHHRRR